MNYTAAILAVVFGVVGYRQAQTFGRQYGRTPWGWPPIVWALAWAFSLLIGAGLFLLAGRKTKRQAQALPVEPGV